MIYKNVVPPFSLASDPRIAFGAYYNTPGGDLIDLSGNTINWDNYRAGSPSASTYEYCIRICNDTNGTWCDNRCDRPYSFAICQRAKGKSVVFPSYQSISTSKQLLVKSKSIRIYLNYNHS